MLRALLISALVLASFAVPGPRAEAVLVCYDPVPAVDDEFKRRGLYIHQACVGNPHGDEHGADIVFRYESGDFDGGPSRECHTEEPVAPNDLQHVRLYHCEGDSGPHGNYTIYVDLCVRVTGPGGTAPACPEA